MLQVVAFLEVSSFPPGCLPQEGAARALQYLRDGAFLDASTERLALRLVTYNPNLDVMGYVRGGELL